MNIRTIAKCLREWSNSITKKYDWLSVRFEFNQDYRRYLVSFAPISQIDNDEEFNRDVLAFEDKVNDKFGDDAPLFCDEESLFKLSDFAESYPVHIENFEKGNLAMPTFNWHLLNNHSDHRKSDHCHYLSQYIDNDNDNEFYSLAA